MKRVLIALLLFVLAAYSLFGQKQWTLQECIQYALDNNIQIKRQELQTQLSKKDYNQSIFNTLPNIGGSIDHNWYSGRRFNNYTGMLTTSSDMTDRFSIYANATLFRGFQILNTIEQNRYALDKNFQDFQKAKNDISIQIATAFLQILFNKESLGIAENQLNVINQQKDKTQKLVNAGSKSKGDLLQIQAQEAIEKYNVVNAKNNLEISYLTLTQLLELKSSEGFSILIPDTFLINNTITITPVVDIFNAATTNLPEVKSSELNLKVTEKGLDIAKGQYYPTLDLSAGFSSDYSRSLKKQNTGAYPFFEQIADNNNNYIGLSLSVPIFYKLSARTNVSKAKIRVLDAQYNVDQTKKTLYQEIQKAHADATAAFERYNAANEAVVSNEESFKYVQQKFDLGVVNTFDYNIAKNDLIKAKSNFIQAKYEYVFKLKVLDFYKGVPLQL